MEQSGEYRISASIDDVWRSLNDPEVLGRCITGCEGMVRRPDNVFEARIKARIGPVSAKFQAELTLADIVPPTSYTIHANVKGGAAGFGRGTAAVSLSEEGDNMLLTYEVKASVGGKLAQVGSRLIDAVARKTADDFFAAFGEDVSTDIPQATGANGGDAEGRFESSGRWLIWTIMFVVVVLAAVLAF